MYHRPLVCILPGPFFRGVCIFGRFYGTPVLALPRVAPPTPRGKGWRFKQNRRFFRIKLGLKMSSFFLLKRGNLIWNGPPKRAFIARHTQTVWSTTPGAICLPWSTKHFEFVVLYHPHTVTHLKRFSKRYELATSGCCWR